MVANTYGKILHQVATPAFEHADIHFLEEVVRIENLSDNTEEKGKVRIETASGLRKTCDDVVVTAPHGWLRQNKASFVPPMPEQLSEAIDSIAYSKLEKVFFHFSQAWWEGNQDGMGNPDRFASGTLFTTPEYAPQTNPGHWNQEIFSFSALPPEVAHPTLLFYIYGDNSKLVTEKIQKLSPDSKEYYDALVSFFEPYYSLLPHYNKSDPQCKPSGCLSTDWEHDKYAGNGSYTHFAVPLKDGAEAVRIIRNGMGADRHIWLAGEHAAPDIALSTIVGAYWSGEGVARKILEKQGLGEASGQIQLDSVP